MRKSNETLANPRKPAADEADLELLARIQRGDGEAFRQLYTKYYHPLLRFTYRVTGQLETAQEAVNDVMLVLWKSGAAFAGRSKLSTWIMGIAYNKALKHLEKSKRWTDRFRSIEAPEAIEPSVPSHELTTDIRDLLEHGMRRLSPQQRAVVELTYYYGHTYEEIAAIVDCPVNTVKTRMFHARAKLKSILPGLGRSEDDR